MATVDRPVAQPGVTERAGGQTTERPQTPALSVFKMVVIGLCALWLVAWLLMITPYVPGVFGGLSTLFSALPSMVMGLFGFLFHDIAAWVFGDLLFGPWLKLGADTHGFLMSGWFMISLAIVGIGLASLLLSGARRIPVPARGAGGARAGTLLIRVVANIIGLLAGLAVLLVLSYPVAGVKSFFDQQNTWFAGYAGWFALLSTIMGAAVVYFMWQGVDNLPRWQGIARVVVVAFGVLVGLQALVMLSYPLQWLGDGSIWLINRLPDTFVSFVKDAWFVVPVLVLGGLMAMLAWRRTRLFAGLIVAGLVIWAHAFGWEVSKIDAPMLVTQAPNMQRIAAGLLQPTITGHDQQRIQVSANSIQGVNAPASDTKPVVLEQPVQVAYTPDSREALAVDPSSLPLMNVKLTVSADKVAPGQGITVSGSGFRPETEGNLYWISGVENATPQNLGLFRADATGTFAVQVNAPTDVDRVVNPANNPDTVYASQQWDVGEPYLTETFWLVLRAMIETVFMALMGTTAGVILSLPLSFLASHNLMSHNAVSRSIYAATRTVLNVLRSIEALILGIMFVVVVGIGPFAGVLALAVHSIASLGKLYSEAIEAIDPGPIEAILATGASRLQMVRYAVIPQFIPQFVSFTLYRWDINVRMSTLIGMVGGGGVGQLITEYTGKSLWHDAGTTVWMIAIVVIAMDFASAKLRNAAV